MHIKSVLHACLFACLLAFIAPAHAAWVHQSDGATANAANTNGTPLAVSYPASIAAGDILILFVRSTTTSMTFTNSDITTSLCSRDTNGRIEVFGKVATGSESGTMTVSANNTNRVIAWISRFTGGTLTVDACQGTGASSGANLDYPSATIANDNELIIEVGGKNANVTSAATLAGYSEMADASGSTLVYIVGDYKIQTTKGNITGSNWTITGDNTGVAKNGLTLSLNSSSPPTFSVSPAIGTRTTSSVPITATTACTDCTMTGVEQTAGAAAPSVTQIKAGQDHTGSAAFKSCSVSPTANVQATCTFSSITDGTVKDAYFALNSAANGDIASASSIANVYKLPAFTSGPTFSSCSATGCTYSATLDGAGTIYGVACIKGSTAATVTQVEAAHCTGDVAAQDSANTAGTSLTIGSALSLPIYDFSIVGTYGSQHEAATHADTGRLLTAPSGKQYQVLASVSATSFCNSITSPSVAAPDIVKIDAVTTPGSNAITMVNDCNLSFTSDGSRQSATYDIYDDSAGGFMAGGPGTLWFNNQAPLAPADNSVIFAYPINQAITPVDMTAYCTDPEGDTITVTNVDSLPTGLSISGSSQSGTPTAGGSYASTTLQCTDTPGASTNWLATYLIGNLTVPNVVNESTSAAINDLNAAYFSFGLATLCDDAISTGNVISQSPAAGTTQVPFTSISLTVSKGPCRPHNKMTLDHSISLH